MNILSRRDFLKIGTETLLALSGLLGLGGLLRFLGYAGEPEQPQIFDLGLAENYPLGSRTLVANGQFVLVIRSLALVPSIPVALTWDAG